MNHTELKQAWLAEEAIAHIHGILKQSLAPFPDVLKMLEE